jgi:hypothetical protein
VKKIILYITTLFTTTLFSLLIIELGFRFYGHLKDIDFRIYLKEIKNSDRLPKEMYDEEQGGFKANAKVLAITSDFSVQYSFNSKKFRDKEYSYEKDPDYTRMVMFGDSFTFGEGVPYGKRFSDIVEEDIANLEILNFGDPGISLDDIVHRILTEGLLFNPDYVVIILNRYVTTRGKLDVEIAFDDYLKENPEISEQKINTPDTVYLNYDDDFFDYQPNFIIKNSYLASYLYYQFSMLKLRGIMEEHDQSFWKSVNGWDKDMRNPRNINQTENNEKILLKERNILVLNKLNEICQKMGIKLVAINIDSEPLTCFYEHEPPFEYFDLSEKVKAESKKYNLSFKYDHHYNEKTNEFLGGEITTIFNQLLNQ